LPVGVRAAADEPTADYLRNVRRSGYTPEPLSPPYRLLWTHVPRHAPRSARHESAWETQRINQDYAFAISATNGMSPALEPRHQIT
jgi:hypothetical protein